MKRLFILASTCLLFISFQLNAQTMTEWVENDPTNHRYKLELGYPVQYP